MINNGISCQINYDGDVGYGECKVELYVYNVVIAKVCGPPGVEVAQEIPKKHEIECEANKISIA